MNLHFNIAIHALTFLLKHKGESISSEKLADLICINPVQLRQVMSILVQNKYVISKKGKFGGYSLSNDIENIKLSSLYELFRNNVLDLRVVTGDEDSDCIVSRNIGQVISYLDDSEHQQLKQFYSKISIEDILNYILEKEGDKKWKIMTLL